MRVLRVLAVDSGKYVVHFITPRGLAFCGDPITILKILRSGESISFYGEGVISQGCHMCVYVKRTGMTPEPFRAGPL